jgi:hypothetical protein
MIRKKYLIDFFVIIISISSFILGFYSSIYNQDFHHWGLQLSYLIDYKNGFNLFKDIYLQYGQGQTIFLYFVDKVFEINLFTIGIVVQLIYCLNLIIIYRVLCIFLKKKYALLILFFIYLIHPYITYPWPDYYSGLCLTLAAFFLLNNKDYNIFNNIFIGFLLFLSILFRTSYLITIVPAFIFFFLFFKNYFFKYKINIIALSFILFLFIYFIFLNKNLSLWYYQGLGSITTYAYGSDHYLMGTIIDKYGENVWIFLKLSKMFLRFLYKLLNIFSLNNFIFTFFLLLNLYYLAIVCFKNKVKKITSLEVKLIFLSFIGFFGFLQSFMIYETFRNINSTLGIFFLGTYIINKVNLAKRILSLIRIIILLLIIILLQKFPNVSNYVHLIFKNNGSFVESSVDYFPKQKLLLTENNFYYKKLNKEICNQDKKIINLSFDFVLPYLCSNNKKKFSAMGPFFAMTNSQDYKRIFYDNILFDDEILITSKDINNPYMKKIFEVELPNNLMWFSIYDDYSRKIFGYIKF